MKEKAWIILAYVSFITMDYVSAFNYFLVVRTNHIVF